MLEDFSLCLQEKTSKMHLLNNKKFLNAFAEKDVEDVFIKS